MMMKKARKKEGRKKIPIRFFRFYRMYNLVAVLQCLPFFSERKRNKKSQ